MKHTISISEGILEVKTCGDASLKDLKSMMADIISHPAWKEYGAVLINHSDLNTAPMTVGEIHAMTNEITMVREQIGRARIAHLVTRDLEYGMVRMWEAYVLDKWDAVTKCFRSRPEAVAWLKKKGS